MSAVGASLVSRCAANIVPTPIEWLWPGRVAIGKQYCNAFRSSLPPKMAQVAAPLTCNPTLELLERKVSRSAHAVVAITHPPKSAVKVRALSSARCLDGDQVWERRAAETEEA